MAILYRIVSSVKFFFFGRYETCFPSFKASVVDGIYAILVSLLLSINSGVDFLYTFNDCVFIFLIKLRCNIFLHSCRTVWYLIACIAI